ncbi:hypothetical protein ABN584_05435 [Gloeocapsa sp. BRSZ]
MTSAIAPCLSYSRKGFDRHLTNVDIYPWCVYHSQTKTQQRSKWLGTLQTDKL